MGTVTEGLVVRLTAAAEGNCWLVRGDFELGPRRIDNRNRSLNEQRAVISDGDGGGHGKSFGWSVLMEIVRADTYVDDAACLNDVQPFFPSRSY